MSIMKVPADCFLMSLSKKELQCLHLLVGRCNGGPFTVNSKLFETIDNFLKQEEIHAAECDLPTIDLNQYPIRYPDD